MKLRIQGNTLRLRLSRIEVEQLRESGKVEAAAEFGPEEKLIYSVEAGGDGLSAEFAQQAIRVHIAKTAVRRWAEGEDVGIYGGDGPMKLTIEKDFQCVTRHGDESEADSFPNPAASR